MLENCFEKLQLSQIIPPPCVVMESNYVPYLQQNYEIYPLSHSNCLGILIALRARRDIK